MKVTIERMLRKDVSKVLAIEDKSFPEPWESEDFVRCLNSKGFLGWVLKCDGFVVAYLIYERLDNALGVTNIAVSPHARRRGFGTMLFNFLKEKLGPRRQRLVFTVSEKDLETHLFLKKQSMKAVKVLKHFYGTGHDGYDFQYTIHCEATLPCGSLKEQAR